MIKYRSASFMLRKFLLLFFSSFFLGLSGSNIHYGLTFNSHAVNQDVRTSLNLTPDMPMSFSEGFSIEFDIKFNPGVQAYGYVCRIISGDDSSFDIISNINAKKLNCVLIDVDKALSNVDFKISVPQNKSDWSKMKIKFGRDNIVCSINDISQTIPYSFKRFDDIKVIFGKNWDKMFYSSDVPPITIKDVIIRDIKKNVLYSWKLDKYAGKKVYDDISRREALVENGSWDIDKYIKWHKEISIPVTERYAQIAFDSIQNRFFIATSDSMIFFDMDDFHVERIKTQKGSPFGAGGSSQMIYDRKNDRLISYSLLYPDFILYDFAKNEWSGDKLDQRFAPAHHHNRFIDVEKNCLVTFGGYGYQTYKAWMSTHSLDGGDWDIEDMVDSIAPRYLSALGYLGEGKFLILGGYGSISGRQEESPKNFYDLYELDSRKKTCKKLFDLTFPKEPVAFSNSMIVDKDKVYALAYNNNRFHTQLNLCEISLSDGSVSILADSIPYNFLDMESFCDLILDEEKTMLYAILLQKTHSVGYSVDLYSLAYPPLRMSDVVQKVLPGQGRDRSFIWGLLSSLFIIVFAGIYVILKVKKKSAQKKKEKNIVPQSEVLKKKTTIELKTPVSTVKLLGGFQVFDKEGKDITDSFTSIVKQIFLYILLSTIKDGKKVTSEKLDETFWFEMDKASASNNRSVNIRKLRLLLEKVGNLAVVNKKSYWFVEMGKDIICDYNEIMLLLKKVKEENIIRIDLLNAILDIAQNGALLPNLNTEWVDSYKSEYSNLLIEILLKSISLTEVESDLNLQVRIANVILLHDNIDEEAIQIKCRALFLLGQKGASKQCFDKYVQDHQRLLNSNPKINYENIITR